MFSFSTHVSQLFTVYTEGNKMGHSIFSAWTERQYIKRIFTVARCGSANQDLFMVHALRCSTTLPSYSSRTLWAVCFQNNAIYCRGTRHHAVGTSHIYPTIRQQHFTIHIFRKMYIHLVFHTLLDYKVTTALTSRRITKYFLSYTQVHIA